MGFDIIRLMKSKTSSIVAAVAAVACALAVHAAKVETFMVHSAAMDKDIPVSAVLPVGYEPARKYPVVYLLHGAGGSDKTYAEMEDVQFLCDRHGFIGISPDGGKYSWWWDSPVDPAFRYETFVIREVMPFVEGKYSVDTRRERRAVLGGSMGGHGACWLGFRHKDLFGAVGSIFGGVDVRPFENNWGISKRLGPLKGNEDRWKAHCSITEAGKLVNGDVELCMMIGTKDFFLKMNREMHELLAKNCVEHTYIEYTTESPKTSGHTQSFAKYALPVMFRFFDNYFKTGSGQLETGCRPHIGAGMIRAREKAGKGAVEIRPGEVNVVVAKDAAPTVRFAAEEMTNYLSRTLGAAVPVSSAPVDGKVNVFLGENEWSRAESLDPKPLVRDGFIVSAKGRSIFLLGVDDAKCDPRDCFTGGANVLGFERATLNAAYDFLERHADVRFFFPGELGTVVGRKDSISVPQGTRKVEPAFTERYFGWWNTAKDGWYDKSVTMREVTNRHWLQLRYGSSRKQCCHGQRHFHYVKRFGKEHPEWFCLHDGARDLTEGPFKTRWGPSYTMCSKLCYSSPIREEIYQDVKAFLTGAPASSRGLKAWGQNCVARRDGKYVDIMPEDGFKACECPNCQAAYDKNDREYATRLVWGLTAEIARRLKAEGVEGGVSQMAYHPYNGVPDFALPDNLQVMVAVPGPFVTGMPERHADQMKTLRDWTDKLGHKVWLWTYPGKYPFSGKMPGIPEICPRAYAKFFTEAAPYIIGGYADNDTDRYMFEALNLYVYAKCGWDPSVDVEALIDDWTSRLFGPAKAEMKAVYDMLERKWINGVCSGRVVVSAVGPVTMKPSVGQLWSEIYNPAAIAQLRRLFDEAAAKTAPGSLEARRVALMRSELFDSLSRQSENADPAAELRRRAARKPVNLISNGDFATKDGWSSSVKWGTAELDFEDKVFGTASVRISSDASPHRESNVQGDFSTFVDIRKGRKYRLSYFIKTKDVVPYESPNWNGAGVCVWFKPGNYTAHYYVKDPSPLLNGSCGWVAQSFEFSPPIDTPHAKFQFRLENSLGTMWVDGVLLEDVTDDRKGQGDNAFMVGVGGFSKAVCNEKGVRDLKEIGADFVRCINISDRATLDLLEKYGIKAVANGVVPGWWGGKTEWAGLMHEKRPLSAYAKAKAKYVPHPAIIAVDIGDEPSKSDFAHYAKVVELLNDELPGVPFALNLFPSYGSHIAITPEDRLKQLGTSSYEDYIRSFCELFPTMPEISFDFYPYSAPAGKVEGYLLDRLSDFAVVSRACRRYGRRLVFCLQANSLFKELEMDMPRLRYQAFTAIAFGARRLVWECYTPSWWEHNILEKDGSRTPRYDRVRTVNSELHALTAEFARFEHVGTRLDGFSAAEGKVLGDALDFRGSDALAARRIACDGKIVVGEFKATDGSGDTAALVAAAWDPEGRQPGAKKLCFHVDGRVRIYGQNGEVKPVRGPDGGYALDLPSDGAFFMVYGGRQ